MKMTLRHTFDHPPQKCWEMFSDTASHVAKFEGMGHEGVTVLEEERSDDSVRSVITGEVEVDGIPGFAKKFIKPKNTVEIDDTWTDPGDGTYRGHFTLDTKGVPVDISGTTSLTGSDDSTEYVVELDMSVNVPIVGKKLAGFMKGMVEQQLADEFRLGDEWLASH